MAVQRGRTSPSEVRTTEEARTSAVGAFGILVSTGDAISGHVIPENGKLVIGRADECDVIVADDSVSRTHAVIHAGTPPTLEVLATTNATRVAGQAIAPGVRVPLAMGAVIELGSAMLVVQRAGAALAANGFAEPPKRASSSTLRDVVLLDATMKQLYGLIDVLAPSMLSVLILGETGVGKEVFAESIHARSDRAAYPFLRVNCAALTESILESELFGHERGAFTGALAAKPGLFESADGGTVLLDEIGELPLSTQAKLLRVLECGEVMRLGSVKPKRVDVRFISATNRDLEARVAEGQFRADLFFRLNGIAVTLPPLRERPFEVPALARHFMQAANPVVSVSDEALAALQAHAWPGNIRELRNVIERAVLLCGGKTILASHLGLKAPPSATKQPGSGLRADVDSFERDRIIAVLDECAGNQSRAAKMLGIGRRTLITKLDTYGIARPRKR